MRLNRIFKLWFASIFLLINICAFASTPTVMLQGVANEMIAQLQQNKSQLKGNSSLIHRIVNRVLVPHIDVNRMAGMVVGRHNWYSSPPSDRREFVFQFKRVVINTYANALESFNDDKVIIYPMRGPATKFATVNSAIIRRNGQRIPISYKLIDNHGAWKVYDFSIEGVSIVSNYRSQFAGSLAKGNMKSLIARLRRYNAS